MLTSIVLSFLATGIATLSFPMEAHYDKSSQRLHKRAEYPILHIESGVFSPLVYLNIGTSGNYDLTSAVLSIQTADLLLQSTSNPRCSSSQDAINQGNGVNCTYAVHLTSSGVRSSEFPDTWFYGFGRSNVTVQFFEADINLNDAVFHDFAFGGIVDGPSEPFFGLGYPYQSLLAKFDDFVPGSGVNPNEFTLPDGYMTPMQAMKSQGLIHSNSFSIWLSSLAPGSPGGVSIGGFDRNRFDGILTSVPIEYQWFATKTVITLTVHSLPIIIVNGVSISDSAGDETTIMRGVTQYILDFESELSLLPHSVVNILQKVFDCTYSSSSGYFYCKCGVPDGYLTFNTRGYEIRVPYSSFILPLRDSKGDWMTDENAFRCIMAVSNTSSEIGFTLGMSVLTSQYTVVHLDANEIGFAPYNGYNSSLWSVKTMDVSRILSATPAPSYSSTYDWSHHSVSLYTPMFTLSMSELYSTTGSPSSSGSGSSVSVSGSGSAQPGGGFSNTTGAVANDATKTTTGRFLKDGTMSFARTEISTINGSPSLVLLPGFVLAWILGFLL